MIQKDKIINILKNKLKFNEKSINKLNSFVNSLLKFNLKYNLVSKSTLPVIWHRHIYDSAQIIPLIDFKSKGVLADFGTGGGFPGLVLSIFNKNPDFHVKLFDKSPVKTMFLNDQIKRLDLNAEVLGNLNNYKKINANYVTARAFRKFEVMLQFSREKVAKPHKLIVFIGKNSQDKLNNISNSLKFKYKLVNSETDTNSKIFFGEVK